MNAPSVDCLQLDDSQILHDDNCKNHSYYRVHHCYFLPFCSVALGFHCLVTEKHRVAKVFPKTKLFSLLVVVDEAGVFLLRLFFGISVFCLQQSHQFL